MVEPLSVVPPPPRPARLPPLALGVITVLPPSVLVAHLLLFAFATDAIPDLWLVGHVGSEILAGAYATLIVVVSVRPDSVILHKIGMVLAVVVYGGRAAAVAVLTVEHKVWGEGSTVAVGGLVGLTLAACWHVVMVWRAGLSVDADLA